MYNKPDSNIHEHILSAINVLIDDNPESIKQAKEMKEINFKQILSERIALISSDPRHQVIFRNFFYRNITLSVCALKNDKIKL
jgi:hypothetical protein